MSDKAYYMATPIREGSGGLDARIAKAPIKEEAAKVETLGDTFDNRIAFLRKELERICVLKAKAEAMQMLEYPMDFIRDVTYL